MLNGKWTKKTQKKSNKLEFDKQSVNPFQLVNDVSKPFAINAKHAQVNFNISCEDNNAVDNWVDRYSCCKFCCYNLS